MLGKIFNLFASRPDLVFRHLSAYVELAQDDFIGMQRRWIFKLIAYGVTIIVAISSLTIAGVAITLGVTGMAPWSLSLFIAPLIGLSICLLVVIYAKAKTHKNQDIQITTQFKEDLSMLHDISEVT
jgi:uncharacterized membrane protein